MSWVFRLCPVNITEKTTHLLSVPGAQLFSKCHLSFYSFTFFTVLIIFRFPNFHTDCNSKDIFNQSSIFQCIFNFPMFSCDASSWSFSLPWKPFNQEHCALPSLGGGHARFSWSNLKSLWVLQNYLIWIMSAKITNLFVYFLFYLFIMGIKCD